MRLQILPEKMVLRPFVSLLFGSLVWSTLLFCPTLENDIINPG